MLAPRAEDLEIFQELGALLRLPRVAALVVSDAKDAPFEELLHREDVVQSHSSNSPRWSLENVGESGRVTTVQRGGVGASFTASSRSARRIFVEAARAATSLRLLLSVGPCCHPPSVR